MAKKHDSNLDVISRFAETGAGATIVEMMADDATNKEIAERLQVTVREVAVTLQSLYTKLHIAARGPTIRRKVLKELCSQYLGLRRPPIPGDAIVERAPDPLDQEQALALTDELTSRHSRKRRAYLYLGMLDDPETVLFAIPIEHHLVPTAAQIELARQLLTAGFQLEHVEYDPDGRTCLSTYVLRVRAA